MMKIIINIILWIWSHSPILALSEDENYATLRMERIRDADLRLSLINIMLGDIILYFITIDITSKKLQMFYKLELQQMPSYVLTEEKIAGIQKRYRSHIAEISQAELEIERESLVYRIQNEEQRLNGSVEKVNIYTTIILTIIPLLLAFIDFNKISKLPISLKIIVGIIIYAVFNICIYIFRAIKVRSISKSSFGDLRKSDIKEKEINVQYQYDWQQLKYKADLFVSFVSNIQDWAVTVLVLSIVATLITSTLNVDNNKLAINIYEDVQTIHIDELDDGYSDSWVNWQSIILDISRKNYNKLLIVIGEEMNELSILKDLDKYGDLEIKIIYDAELNNGIIKIIKEDTQ